MTVGGRFGIGIGILAFIVLILIGFRTKQTPEEQEQSHDLLLQPKELTPKELQKENKELWGCFIVVVIGIIIWFIVS